MKKTLSTKKLLSAIIAMMTLLAFSISGSAWCCTNGCVYVRTQGELINALNSRNDVISIRLEDDIRMTRSLNIQKSVSIDMNGHKIEFFSNGTMCNIGDERKVYAIYSSYCVPTPKTETTTYIDEFGRVITTAQTRMERDVEYYFSRLSYSRNTSFNEVSYYLYSEYLDNINVEIYNGYILGKSINDKCATFWSRPKGQLAINVISGNVTLDHMYISGGKGACGKKGDDAKVGIIMNSKAGDGCNGTNGGNAIEANNGSNVTVMNSIVYGGEGGNGGAGGDCAIKSDNRALYRSLTGEGGKPGKGGLAWKKSGYNTSLKILENCDVRNGNIGAPGFAGIDFNL